MWEGRLLGLSFLTDNDMGLDCIPLRFALTAAGISNEADEQSGLTHLPDEPCPFANDNFPIGMLGTCCSLRGKAAAYELAALGETELSNRMYSTMTIEEAGAFADELRGAADRLEQTYADKPKPEGASWNNFADGKVTPVRTPFDEALATIREAARWYEKVATLGFGVHAWY